MTEPKPCPFWHKNKIAENPWVYIEYLESYIDNNPRALDPALARKAAEAIHLALSGNYNTDSDVAVSAAIIERVWKEGKG